MKLDVTPYPFNDPIRTISILDFIDAKTLKRNDVTAVDYRRILATVATFHYLPINMIQLELPFVIKVVRCYDNSSDIESNDRELIPIHSMPSGMGPDYREYGLGAVDVTTDNLGNLAELYVAMARGPWTRITVFPKDNYIHADYVAEEKSFCWGPYFKQTTFEVLHEKLKEAGN